MVTFENRALRTACDFCERELPRDNLEGNRYMLFHPGNFKDVFTLDACEACFGNVMDAIEGLKPLRKGRA
jgi:hypothetical protein